ncbi:uncharacterized protein TOT_040000437 [Theileria orientalis strain Shintoku]|uniref:Peptidase C14 caspase domain-containing protein n=1 Tax=Theileria orientalis strain Shintoku TaxID=869250 RepID=J4C4E8_THEOR|nr:uncharacterized protein TOT_040000437 [Theileria orientalis strain Shintoku]BAM42061.1 uncharacterized protein TOT_040000437 [Theileria orientalis strain Shintoku]|eukprot:XP_009692362.1 uncharacterized protein TOT_040000437 [Theileria orientalis strain Shintoku]
MDLVIDKVSNVDSDLMQGASENESTVENQTNSLVTPDKLLYKTKNNEALSGIDKFTFDKTLEEEHTLLKSEVTGPYPQNLEQLIQESVSKSTARLLTKNALKYLDKDLEVSAGEGVSKQFTVRSAKKEANSKATVRKEEGFDLPLKSTVDKSAYESTRSIYIDPKISSFRLHKVTYEMYKLFENIRAFDSSSRADKTSNRGSNAVESESVSANANAQPSMRKLSIVSSNFGETEQSTGALFESRLKPKPFPSVSTLYPEDSNHLTYSISNRFGNSSSSFSGNSERFEGSAFNSSDLKTSFEQGFLDKAPGIGSGLDQAPSHFTSTDYGSRDYNQDDYLASSYDDEARKKFSYPMVYKTADYTKFYDRGDSKDLVYGVYKYDTSNYNTEAERAQKYSVERANKEEFQSGGYKGNFETRHQDAAHETSEYKQDECPYSEETNYKSAPSKGYPTEHNGDFELYKIDLNFKEKVDVEPFATAVSKSKDVEESEAVNYTCFSSGKKADDKGLKNESNAAGSAKKAMPAGSSNLPNRQSFNPNYVTKVYVPLDRMNLLPKRRAVVVGCNYLGNPNAQLRGSCNDAFAFAQVLVTKYNFDPSEVVLLLDSRPSPAYTRYLSQFNQNNPFQPNQAGNEFNLDLSRVKSNIIERNVYPTKKTSMFGWHLVDRDLKHLALSENLYVDAAVIPAPEEMQPTRANVFRSLKWLNYVSAPNDFALFYFSGQSVQVDDLSGYEGDGFDEALVPADYERNGLVTCNDLKCLFQSIGATCRLNVFLDTCNMQTVVGGSSRAGPVKGSKMKGIWPFSEPTGKLNTFKCGDWVDKDQKMINQMARAKFIPTLQVDSLSSLSDVQLSLDATHGVVNYCVLSSSNLNSVSLECLFKPLNLGQSSKGEPSNMVTEDEVIVHGAFTYALLLTLLYDKSSRRGGLGVDEVVEGVNRKLSQLKRIRLPRLNQQCEALFYHSSKLPKNAFLFPPNFSKYQRPKPTGSSYGFYLPGDAWLFMVDQGREMAREHQQKFERMKTDLITLTNLNNKLFNQNEGATKLNTTRTQNAVNPDHHTSRSGSGVGQFKSLPNTLEASMKPAANPSMKTPGATGRSMTNNVSARVFTRNSSVAAKGTSRSKTAAVNNVRTATARKFTDVIQSHNWYGGCTASAPFNATSGDRCYYSQPTWYAGARDDFNFGGASWNDQAYYDQYYHSKLGTIPVYEPITDAMLQNLPTRRSFNVLYQKF